MTTDLGTTTRLKRISEPERLATLHSLHVLDTEPDSVYDELVALAADICNVPISLISLIDTDRQWFKANKGLPGITETSRDIAFCTHALEVDTILEVQNAVDDARFTNNPLVTGEPNICFYAGAPLRLSNGAVVGTLCVIDRKPGQLSNRQRKSLQALANTASSLLESRRTTVVLAEERMRLAATIEGTGAGTWEWNIQTGEFRSNDQFKSISGKPECEWSDIQQWASLIHPDDILKSSAIADQHFKGENSRFECELRIKHKDNSWTWVLDSGQVVSSTDSGEPEWMFGTRLDINNRNMQAEALKNAHERIQLATEGGQIGVWDWDIESNIFSWDDKMYDLYGLPANSAYRRSGKVTYKKWINYLHPCDRVATTEVIDHALKFAAHYDSDYRLLAKDGSIRYLRSTGKISRNKEGKATRLLGVTWDATPIRRLSNQLLEQHDLLRVTLNSIADAVITTDAEGRINWLNPAAEILTGWPVHEAQGQPLANVFKVIIEETRESAPDPIFTILKLNAVSALPAQSILITRNGTEIGIENSASPIKSSDEILLGVVLTFRDVTEKRRLSRQLGYRASHDSLTDLINRSEFENRLKKTFTSSQIYNSKNVLMYIDLDRFKLINDACGHAVGDEVLQNVAKLLSQHIRASDTLARIGGDEFAVILENCTCDHAHHIASDICREVNEFRFLHNGKRLRIGTSIGMVPLDKRWESIQAVLQAADTSCYAAKEAGRNRVQIWYDTDTAIRARRDDLQWASRLEHALDFDQFQLYAQRIENLEGKNEGLHAEVLIRLRNDEGMIVEPNAFIPSAERFQMASRLDHWMLNRVINSLRQMKNISTVSMLSINLSDQSVGDQVFQKDTIALLRQAGKNICHRLCLEITETAAVTNIADASSFIKQAHELGVQLTNDALDEATVRCFVDVAQVLGLTTVAKYVSTPEIAERTTELGVNYAQGFSAKTNTGID